jgi:ribosomal protein S19E (S16A)
MSAELTSYELFVLRGHQKNPRRESEIEKRRAALVKLSKLGYLELKSGVYHITPAGRQVLDETE